MSHSVPVVSFQSDLSFTKMAFLMCKMSLEIGTKRLTYQSRWQTRPLQSKESIVATSSADSSKSKIWAFSIIRDFVTDLGIVILPRCTWNHIDTYILKLQKDFTTFHYMIIIFMVTIICHFLCALLSYLRSVHCLPHASAEWQRQLSDKVTSLYTDG